MAEARRITLLDFAIAASIAVVPVLLGVLLLVAVIRPMDPTAPAVRNGDRHVSTRQLAALKTFERAIVRRDSMTASAPSAQTLLDGVPQCREAWERRHGLMDRVRAALSKSAPAPSPAERLAAQLSDLDDELLRFSTGLNRRVSAAVGFGSGGRMEGG